MKMMLISLALAVGTTSISARAGEDVSHEVIRQLVEQGELLSLNQIKAIHPDYFRGRLLRLEIEKKSGLILYELILINEEHKVIELKIDASSGELLEAEQENSRARKSCNSDKQSRPDEEREHRETAIDR